MTAPASDEITHLRSALRGSEDEAALAQLLPVVYDELWAIADAYLRRERPDHTLQTTALVHEAYLHLVSGDAQWGDRKHFYRLAAQVMRRILVNHAIAHKAKKRGGGRHAVSVSEITATMPAVQVDLVELNDALERLAEIDTQKARVVELRFFAGCTIGATAEALEISTATVERDWRFSRAWLRAELGEVD